MLMLDEFVSLVKAFGFTLSRINGSHHIFTHPDIPEPKYRPAIYQLVS